MMLKNLIRVASSYSARSNFKEIVMTVMTKKNSLTTINCFVSGMDQDGLGLLISVYLSCILRA